MGVSWPDATVTPQEGSAQLEPPMMQTMASEVGQMGGDTVKVSPVVVVAQ